MTEHLQTSFANYKQDNRIWITLAKGLYYPDYLEDATNLYKPIQELFGQLVQAAPTSEELFRAIQSIPEQAIRVQLARVFRKYVSPETSVEMLKVKAKVEEIIKHHGTGFRPIQEVQKAFMSRPVPDEALIVLFRHGQMSVL